jgi:hypothetical protein
VKVRFLILRDTGRIDRLYNYIGRCFHRTTAEYYKFGTRHQISFSCGGWLEHPAKDAVTLHKSGRRQRWWHRLAQAELN